MFLLPGSINMNGPGAKPSSPLSEPVNHILLTGLLRMDCTEAASKTYIRYFG